MGIPKKKKKGGVLVGLIPLGVEPSWQGDFLSLARNFFVCPPEGGLGSSWLKHALKQRPPTTLIGVVRVVVVLVLERVFVGSSFFGFSA